MRGMHYTRATRSADNSNVPSNSYVSEALAKQAALRGPKAAPNALPVTPTLPRVPKRRRQKRPK